MQLLLTSVLPFLAHNHASAAAFLTCRHHNFHASIIPEFLSDEDRVDRFCEARPQNQLEVDKEAQYTNLYNLFVQTPLMQFSPSLVLRQKNSAEVMLKPLLATKYFTRSLQRCSLFPGVEVTNDLLQGLSNVQSLIKLDLGFSAVEDEHLEMIVNSFPCLEALAINRARHLETVDDPKMTAINTSSSPPPPVTKTLRSLNLDEVDVSFVTQFVPHFSNLRKLQLREGDSSQPLDLYPLSSSLPLLTDLSLALFDLENIETLKNLIHLSTLQFHECRMPDSLSFLTPDNRLCQLTRLCVNYCDGLSTSSFASLSNAPNLQTLEVNSDEFDKGCLLHLQDMIHLRKLELISSNNAAVGDSSHGSLKTLMQNLFQLEELKLYDFHIGGQGAIAGALYSTHSRLRVLNLCDCDLVDSDLNGIGVLKNTLEVLELAGNGSLTNEGLRQCKDLVKLKKLKLERCDGINDLSPLKYCPNLQKLDGEGSSLSDDSFKVFSEEPNSFPNLRVLHLSSCKKLTGKVCEHLSMNNYLVYQLQELDVMGIVSSTAIARNICQLKGLRKLHGIAYYSFFATRLKKVIELKRKMVQRLKNIEEII